MVLIELYAHIYWPLTNGFDRTIFIYELMHTWIHHQLTHNDIIPALIELIVYNKALANTTACRLQYR